MAFPQHNSQKAKKRVFLKGGALSIYILIEERAPTLVKHKMFGVYLINKDSIKLTVSNFMCDCK